MSTLLVVLLVVVTEVMGGLGPHAHQHRRSSRSVKTRYAYETKVCSEDHQQKVEDGIITSNCVDPKEVFVVLGRRAAHEMNMPSAVWVKRCVGHCYSSRNKLTCVPLKTQIKHVPVRISNIRTRKERCATVPVEEHLACGGWDGPVGLCTNYTKNLFLT